MSAASSPQERPTQIIAFLKRNPSLTRDEFYEHWEKKHAVLVAPFFQKQGVIGYQQIRTAGVIHSNHPGSDPTQLIEFDGVALSLVHDLKLMEARGSDPYYRDVVKPDEERFLDKEAPGEGVVAVFAGGQAPIIEGGKVVGV
ncbi:hypothetical protein EJ04DRAFT_580569 [Polyplosphaeria fusca]|uniref:EthD domain-containing protein n=1 Tax=Polyplosphaeria fusca TaxID=682080 RepID=A0A9P4UY10_9PLEO|nr:hypothetical protein EJ04DRAFT_580569 [Polyplosphaeria fusca]